MTTISLRLPDSLHKAVRELVKQEGISINQFLRWRWRKKFLPLLRNRV